MKILIFLFAVYGLIVSDELIRKVMCLQIIESIVILSFLSTGYLDGARAPILTEGHHLYVDPIPQALMLTAIVIGVCFNSLALACIIRIFEQKKTTKVSEFDNH